MCYSKEYKVFRDQKKAEETRIVQERRAEVIDRLLNEANKTKAEGTAIKEIAAKSPARITWRTGLSKRPGVLSRPLIVECRSVIQPSYGRHRRHGRLLLGPLGDRRLRGNQQPRDRSR